MRVILTIFLLSMSLFAKTPYEKGKILYMQKGCNNCHGNRAEGMQRSPYLANRAKGFLTYKLKRFRSGKADTQQQEIMIMFTSTLSDEDIDNLTTYLENYHDDKNAERYDDSYQTWGDGGS
ncbi:cytochrome c [Sulfurimonas sp. C5]|uniref:c-type cytochrome n=1 Tax=Sulfurimonas sp. C5 TaxID=3036947 RepID=UPI00245904FB|nr:cytochrome c [Sulfurimonas sp. C5]MDH4943733.1 c-type cytochrome [Sulfurimonas sp. C5]